MSKCSPKEEHRPSYGVNARENRSNLSNSKSLKYAKSREIYSNRSKEYRA